MKLAPSPPSRRREVPPASPRPMPEWLQATVVVLFLLAAIFDGSQFATSAEGTGGAAISLTTSTDTSTIQ